MQSHFSRLGFGLSSIAGSGNFAHQQRLVKTAIDCGITHFDTAPYYGGGDSEKILGKILAGCPARVTIATKFGLAPLGRGQAGSLLRNLVRPVFRHARALKSLAVKMVSQVHSPAQIQVSGPALLASLEESTRHLGRPVDVFLLHDASFATAAEAGVREALIQARTSGRISLAGVSGTAETLLSAAQKFPDVYAVTQLENSLPRPAPVAGLAQAGARVITYRAIQAGVAGLQSMGEKNPACLEKLRRETGLPGSPEALAAVLLELALFENPDGTVLFSTTRPERIPPLAAMLQTPLIGPDGCRRLRRLFNEAEGIHS